MNEKAEFAVKILKLYALENGIPARSTSDLSPMEEWLILKLLAASKNFSNTSIIDPSRSESDIINQNATEFDDIT